MAGRVALSVPRSRFVIVTNPASWMQFEPARTVGRAVTLAVRTAAAADAPGYPQVAAALTTMHPATSGLVLGAVVRRLLEDQHAAGLDGDDIRQVLRRCWADSAAWLPPASVSPVVLIAVLSSALGIHEPGVTYTELFPPEAAATEWADPDIGGGPPRANDPDGRPPTAAEYAWHAPLLIASLLGTSRRRMDSYLDAAFAEIARSQTMEQP